MIIYDETISTFIENCYPTIPNSERIENIIEKKFFEKTGGKPTSSEKESWKASLPKLADVLKKTDADKNCKVGLEYKISGGRIDFLICGKDKLSRDNLIIIELKQWSDVQASKKRNFIFTNTHSGIYEDDLHPSFKAKFYMDTLVNTNKLVEEKPVIVHACSYLFNMPQVNERILMNEELFEGISFIPSYLSEDFNKLVKFINEFVKTPSDELLYQIDHSEIKPSNHLSKTLSKAISGNPFFTCSIEQENAVSEILMHVKDALEYNEKRVIIIKGGAGTGKTVVATNVLGQLISPKRGPKYNAAYFAVNSAIRTQYSNELINEDYSRAFLKTLFKYPTVLKRASENTFDCGIFDEAHRFFDFKPGVGLSKGEHLLREAINACRVSVFFVDGDQCVTSYDYATEEHIREVADSLKIRVFPKPNDNNHIKLELTNQFRCLGGDEYIQFIKNLLGYANDRSKFEFNHYDFKIFDSADEMFKAIKEKDLLFQEKTCIDKGKIFVKDIVSGKCRLVAGYTHNWISQGQGRDGDKFDFNLDNGSFIKKWNLRTASLKNYSWIDDPLSIDEIGCIHTAQGLDFNYCGVIIGKDLRYENGKLVFDKTQNATTDSASNIRNCDDQLAEKLIRNTYHVLLTRGMCGTYVYCEDAGLREYLKSFQIHSNKDS